MKHSSYGLWLGSKTGQTIDIFNNQNDPFNMKHCPPYMACPHELPTAAVFYRKSSQSAFQYGWRRGPRGFVPVALLAPGGCWDRRRHFSSGRLLLLRGLFHIHAQVSCTAEEKGRRGSCCEVGGEYQGAWGSETGSSGWIWSRYILKE